MLVPGGEFVLGVDGADEPWSLDNERPAHVVDVPAFRIGRVPVTNAEYAALRRRRRLRRSARWWSAAAGRTASRPGWSARSSGRPTGHAPVSASSRTLPPDEPVQHVCFFEAEAYAALGRRPAAHRAGVGEGLRVGSRRSARAGAGRGAPPESTPALANLGGDALRPAPVGAYPAGASAYGVEQLIGDVWEWTSSPFTAWPGFTPMLYRAVQRAVLRPDDEFRVLRGGSWAVGGQAIRPSFRNWDLPIRRQIFCGFRLAWDVADV